MAGTRTQQGFVSSCYKPRPPKHLFTNLPPAPFAVAVRNRDSDRMNDVAARILLVDDDARLRELLLRYLQSQGFEAKGAGDALQMQQLMDRGHYDLIVLDLMLPEEDGLQICRRLRGQGDVTPIVMLTAKGDEIDRIVGLEIGADDYLPKPVNPRELVARIKAVLRRTRPVPGAPKPEGGEIRFGEFRLDLGTRQLLRNGNHVRLTSGEFSVLAALLRYPRQPLSRDRLMSLAHGREHDAFERSIDVTIARLRRLLEEDLRNPRLIQTVWGRGYVYVPPGEAP